MTESIYGDHLHFLESIYVESPAKPEILLIVSFKDELWNIYPKQRLETQPPRPYFLLKETQKEKVGSGLR